jgi:hypothetical protein
VSIHGISGRSRFLASASHEVTFDPQPWAFAPIAIPSARLAKGSSILASGYLGPATTRNAASPPTGRGQTLGISRAAIWTIKTPALRENIGPNTLHFVRSATILPIPNCL